MITILHSADWHLGQTFFGYDRVNEHRHFLFWLKQPLVEQEIDVLLVSGDVFDVANPSAQSQKQFYQFIQEVTLLIPHLQIVIIAGNHDSPSRLEAPLPILQDRKVTIKGVVKKLEGVIDYSDLIVPLVDRDNQIAAYCLAVPFLRQGDYPRVEADNPYAAGVRLFYETLIDQANRLRSSKQGLVAMGHLQAIGSEIAERDHSEKTIIGGLECVSPDLFSDINYAALGHIHKAQRLSKQEHIRYSGSPLPMSFAEKHYKHGVVKVVIDQGITQSIEKIEYQPLASLISVPSKGSLPPLEVLDKLGDLPTFTGEEGVLPYLEIKVDIKEPEPMFQQRVSEALEGKAVRLTRIVNEYRLSRQFAKDKIITRGLDEFKPLDIVKETFKDRYDEDLPDSLEKLFMEVYSGIHNKEEE